MSVEKLFLRWVDAINEWVGKIVSFLIVPITFITMLEVILRYIVNRPTIWAWDVNVQLTGAMIILSGGYVLLKEGHVAVDVVVNNLSLRNRAIISIVISPIFFISIGVLVWQGAAEGWHSLLVREHTGSYFGPPIYWLKMLVPIGVSFLLLQGVAKFIRDLKIVTQSYKSHGEMSSTRNSTFKTE